MRNSKFSLPRGTKPEALRLRAKRNSARAESAKPLVDRVREIAGGKPAFCTDGFNSGQSTEACKTIASVSDY